MQKTLYWTLTTILKLSTPEVNIGNVMYIISMKIQSLGTQELRKNSLPLIGERLKNYIKLCFQRQHSCSA